jgi:hypothetical protein
MIFYNQFILGLVFGIFATIIILATRWYIFSKEKTMLIDRIKRLEGTDTDNVSFGNEKIKVY